MTFHGIHLDDWGINFGNFSDHHKLLTEEYESDGCNSTATSSAILAHKFIYPEHIKKVYFIEGTITGHVTFAASGATAYMCKYKVSVCKVHQNTDETELFTTGWKEINHTFGWNDEYNTPSIIKGEEGEVVYPFRIDAWENEKLDAYERIYVKVESTCSDDANFNSCSNSSCTNLVLWHGNDATYEDLKIEIPFKL